MNSVPLPYKFERHEPVYYDDLFSWAYHASFCVGKKKRHIGELLDSKDDERARAYFNNALFRFWRKRGAM